MCVCVCVWCVCDVLCVMCRGTWRGPQFVPGKVTQRLKMVRICMYAAAAAAADFIVL